ncbi:hypothetical protein NDA16_000206 [Ustilago loliicola]|nr:hypothetical protein NDA16_000206 [Ustilago loliicola]
MDEDPDFDYEMDPQAVYSAIQGSAEEVMDDVGSEGMPMSDAGMHSEPMDKASFDIDFQDSADPQHASSDVQFSTEPTDPETSGYSVDEQIVETSHDPSQNHVYESITTITSEAGAKAPQEAFSTVLAEIQTHPEGNTIITANASKENGDQNDAVAVDQWQSSSTENQGEYAGEEQEEEQDELNQGVGVGSIHDPAVPATIEEAAEEEEEERDQFEVEGEQEQQTTGEEAEGTQTLNGIGEEGYYHSDDHEVSTVRVTFNGQDFVMWSSTDIPAYVALPTKPQETESGDDTDQLVQIEAPALDVPQDVLWQPLDSLFAGLRERKALGDFLEEAQELHLNFPDLDLDVAEDNLYCRELTLDDLLQLHHGLGLETSLHVQVSERQRFITKYNELAQHVAGILGNQLQHSSDEEDEMANAGHPAQDRVGVAGEENPVGLQNGHEAHSSNQVGGDEARSHAPLQEDGSNQDASKTTQANVPDPTEAPTTLSEPQTGTVPESAPPAHKGGEQQEVVDELKPKALQTEEHSRHVEVDERNPGDEEQDELDATTAGTEAEQQGVVEAKEEDDQEGALKNESGVEHHAEQGGAEEEEEIDLTAEEEEEEYEDEVEGEEYEDEVEGEEHEGEAEAEDYEEEAEAEEYEDYAGETGNVGEEAEQTFYTSINEGSGAEEDELEEPEQATVEGENAASLLHNAQPAPTSESTTTYEAGANDEVAWQGTSNTHQSIPSSKTPADESSVVHDSRRLPSTSTDGTEEQFVEYTEEEGGNNLDAGSRSLATSTSYDTSTLRKRSFVDEDDTAEYEEDERVAESKRVKVD